MSKKLYFLISFVLVLSLAGSASAQTFWTDGSGDHLWCNPANWDSGLPELNPDPALWGVEGIINTAAIQYPVLIGPGCDAETAWLGVGDSCDTGPGIGLNMTGGTLTAIEISLGTCDAGFGWMTMSGGTIDLVDYSYLSVGSNGGEGRLDMTGGTINVLGTKYEGAEGHEMWTGCVRLPKNEGKCEGNDGVGHIQLDGGTINTRMLVIADGGTMDIIGGTMIIQDNPAMVAFYLGPNPLTYYINGWIADGNLTAYGGTGSVGVAYVETEDVNEPNEVWLIGRYFGTAWWPQPSDGAIDILRDVVLRWQPGDVQATNGHKLYFADNFPDVNNRSGTPATLTDPCYSAGALETLEPAMTYYWAVDEVNGPNTWPGPVWCFTMDRGVAKDPDPPDEAEDVNSRALTLSWAPGMDANDVNGHEVYFGTSYAEVNDANTSTPVVYRGPNDVLGPDGNDRYSYVIPGGDLPFALGESYFWRIDEVNDPCLWKGDVWSFTVEGLAYNVYPADGAEDIPAVDLLLRWTAGADADGHDVYFGSDEADVENATTASDPNLYRGNQALADVNYLVEPLETGKDYFWRIDEVNAVTVKGKVWSFTTGTFLIVDNFEPYRYVDHAEIRAVWKDFWTGTITKNGAEIFLEDADEDKILGPGKQSMRFYYRNRLMDQGKPVGSIAEADLPLEVGTNWEAGGVKALVMTFCGDTANLDEPDPQYTIANDRMWVALEDGSANEGVVIYPDMNDINDGDWHHWDISLLDPNFSGVNMANIVKVYIGFGGVKGGGVSKFGAGIEDYVGDTVWFDDIRLYPPRCMPEMTGLDVLSDLGDIGGGEEGAPDCNTNYLDLEIMVDDWLASDANVMATAPSDVNLVARWEFEGDFNDSNGSNDGDPNGDATTGYDAVRDSNVLSLDGVGDWVEIPDSNTPGGVFDIRNAITLTAWIKVTSFDNKWAAIITKGDHCWRMARNAGRDALEFGHTDLSGGDYIVGSIPVDDNLWHHAAGVYDGSKVALYIDGILDNTEERTGLIRSTSENVWIGSNENYPDSSEWNGFIDDVRVYNCALTVGEISVLAGKEGSIYVPLDVPGNLVPRVPDPAVDPNYYPDNPDIVNFLDYRMMAEHWLEQHPWP